MMTRDEFDEIDRAFMARDNAASDLGNARERAQSAQKRVTEATRYYEDRTAALRALCDKHGIDPGAPKCWGFSAEALNTAVAEQQSQ